MQPRHRRQASKGRGVVHHARTTAHHDLRLGSRPLPGKACVWRRPNCRKIMFLQVLSKQVPKGRVAVNDEDVAGSMIHRLLPTFMELPKAARLSPALSRLASPRERRRPFRQWHKYARRRWCRRLDRSRFVSSRPGSHMGRQIKGSSPPPPICEGAQRLGTKEIPYAPATAARARHSKAAAHGSALIPT
jgi:hypothetical protein